MQEKTTLQQLAAVAVVPSQSGELDPVEREKGPDYQKISAQLEHCRSVSAGLVSFNVRAQSSESIMDYSMYSMVIKLFVLK